MSIIRKPIVTLVLAVLAVFAAGAGGVAYASHQFSDVGTSSFYHEPIDAIVSAGCATGFPDGTFRSGDGASRGQFAYWTANCGGRAEQDSDFVDLPDLSAPLTASAATMEAGAVGSGGGYGIALLSVNGVASDCSSGCQVTVDLQQKDASSGSFVGMGSTTVDFFPQGSSPAANSQANGTVFGIFPLESGNVRQVRAVATKQFGDGTPRIYTDLVLLSSPFDGTGQGF